MEMTMDRNGMDGAAPMLPRFMPLFSPREGGVDTVWHVGDGVSIRNASARNAPVSRLNKIMAALEYKLMTIRNWNTTTRLLERRFIPPSLKINR